MEKKKGSNLWMLVADQHMEVMNFQVSSDFKN